MDVTELKQLIDVHGREPGSLIPLLQKVQDLYGYVPEESIEIMAKELSLFPVEIFGILSFYSQFHTSPRGKHIIRVCQGTACHVMGGKDILDILEAKLGIRDSETTPDGMFTLERVACLGCCGMAPVIMVDDNFHGNLTAQDLDGLLKTYQEEGQ